MPEMSLDKKQLENMTFYNLMKATGFIREEKDFDEK